MIRNVFKKFDLLFQICRSSMCVPKSSHSLTLSTLLISFSGSFHAVLATMLSVTEISYRDSYYLGLQSLIVFWPLGSLERTGTIVFQTLTNCLSYHKNTHDFNWNRFIILARKTGMNWLAASFLSQMAFKLLSSESKGKAMMMNR